MDDQLPIRLSKATFARAFLLHPLSPSEKALVSVGMLLEAPIRRLGDTHTVQGGRTVVIQRTTSESHCMGLDLSSAT